jgi:Family of unknown function (DUF6941)
MKLTMLLCDSAQAVSGKLYVLGGGWNVTGPEPSSSAIALQIDVPWDLTNTQHKLRLDLVTDDGQPVMIPTPTGQSPAQITAEFEVGRPAGHKAGTPLGVVLAVNIGPLPLSPGGRYEWHCHINEETRDEWRVAFSVRAAVARA